MSPYLPISPPQVWFSSVDTFQAIWINPLYTVAQLGGSRLWIESCDVTSNSAQQTDPGTGAVSLEGGVQVPLVPPLTADSVPNEARETDPGTGAVSLEGGVQVTRSLSLSLALALSLSLPVFLSLSLAGRFPQTLSHPWHGGRVCSRVT